MASKPPDAFLSDTRFDDENDGGAISEFRRRLASAVRAVTGEPFEIFQDVDGIGLGERWRGKLDEMLDEVRFFIPIVTPSYFRSKACREELEKFLQAEAERGRDDLILPMYYIESHVLEEEELRATDPLARVIHERQRQDWRDSASSHSRPRRFGELSSAWQERSPTPAAVRCRRQMPPGPSRSRPGRQSRRRPRRRHHLRPSPAISPPGRVPSATPCSTSCAPWPELARGRRGP